MTYLAVVATRTDWGSEIIFDWSTSDTYGSDSAVLCLLLHIIQGLAKSLKVGPCRIPPEQKTQLRGFLSPRFVLLFFACGLALFEKAAALADTVTCTSETETSENDLGAVDIAIFTFFLPGFIIGLFACWHRGILKTFLAHPSIFLPSPASLLSPTQIIAAEEKEQVRGGGGGEKSNASPSPQNALQSMLLAVLLES